MRYEYSKTFIREDNAIRYHKKFQRKIDRIRHKIESNILNKYIYGSCFDCSIGTGRFIDEMSKAVSYSGMDYAEDFVEFIKNNFAEVEVTQGDLLKGINRPEEKYDTVICIRTLSSLGDVDNIVKEMTRIAKRGGLVIFDYRTRKKTVKLDDGSLATIGDYNIDEILDTNGLKKHRTFNLDSFFIYSLKTSRKRLLKYFNSKWNMIPDSFYIFFEKALSLFNANRRLYILVKI